MICYKRNPKFRIERAARSLLNTNQLSGMNKNKNKTFDSLFFWRQKKFELTKAGEEESLRISRCVTDYFYI